MSPRNEISNGELANYFGRGESYIRGLLHEKKSNGTGEPKSEKEKKEDLAIYNALLREYREYQHLAHLRNKPTVLMTLGFKGGVGKSTIALLLNEELHAGKSNIINLDITRDIKEYTSLEAINATEFAYEHSFVDDNDMPLMSEIIDIYKDVNNFIILDTPGELSNSVFHSIAHVDLFVFPIKPGEAEDEDVLLTTLEQTVFDKEVAAEYPANKALTLCFVANDYVKDGDLKDFETFKNRKEDKANGVKKGLLQLIDENRHLYSEINICYTQFKYTASIKTMRRDKKSLAKLNSEMRIAYQTATNRAKVLGNDVKQCIASIK
jgi:MinD-like ATPase involved in chromosome partitioning or flagellar assembly